MSKVTPYVRDQVLKGNVKKLRGCAIRIAVVTADRQGATLHAKLLDKGDKEVHVYEPYYVRVGDTLTISGLDIPMRLEIITT